MHSLFPLVRHHHKEQQPSPCAPPIQQDDKPIITKNDLSSWSVLKHIVLGVAAAFAAYHILTMAYVIRSLTAAAAGPFGLTLAVNDALSAAYPTHTVLLQRMSMLPLANPGALTYYEQQRDFFLDAARNFELHPYWSTYQNATGDMTFRQVVTARIRAMHQQFVESGLDSYRLEKDRCAQFDFLKRNHIPHPTIRKVWYDKDQVLQDVTTGAALQDLEDFPVFFKACHLTQRSSLGTYAVKSRQAYFGTNEQVAQKDEVAHWIQDKWDYRSRDVDRPWQAEGDALTDELRPAILVQDPMMETTTSSVDVSSATNETHASSFALDGRIALGLVELKAEVLWGKVYLMQIDGTTVFLRNGDVEDYGTFMGGVLHRGGTGNNHPRTAWIRQGGYLQCVMETAERVAAAAHIEYIRVDIFLDRGNPANCQVNEVSLSSGYSYFGHEPYLARLWAEPLQRGLYKTLNSTTPVYELTSTLSL